MDKRDFEMLMMLREIDRKVSRQNWLWDFSSNIAGNAVWDAAVFLGRKLINRIRF